MIFVFFFLFKREALVITSTPDHAASPKLSLFLLVFLISSTDKIISYEKKKKKVWTNQMVVEQRVTQFPPNK